MPRLADIEASYPRCDRVRGQMTNAPLGVCGLPMRWFMDDGSGKWCCPKHGPLMSGQEAAERAGFAARVESEAA